MPSDAEHGVLRDLLRHIDLAERFTRSHFRKFARAPQDDGSKSVLLNDSSSNVGRKQAAATKEPPLSRRIVRHRLTLVRY
jgi:hypothetical protein